MRRLTILGAAALVALAVVVPASAQATPIGGPRTPTPTGEIVGGTPSVVIAVDGRGGTMATRTYRSSRNGPAWTCRYFGVRGGPGSSPELGIDLDRGVITPEPGNLVALTCFEGARQVHQEIFTFDPQQPFGSIFAAGDAALLARELLPLPDPDIATSPPADRDQLVGLATWLRVGDAWQSFSATATLGGVSATVTATPVEVAWDPGDGTPAFTCDGPGKAFDPSRPGATTDCSHIYTVATAPGVTVELTATVTYEVAWTATDGSADALDPVTRTATVPLTVGEVEALVR